MEKKTEKISFSLNATSNLYMMHHPKRYAIHRGFSLLELLLVIFIISLVYFLGFSGVEKQTPKKTSITPMTLKKSIMQNELFSGEGTFLCINHCTSCYLRKDISSAFEPYEGNIKLSKLKAYTINRDEMLQKLEFGRYQDEKICLLFHIYPNGSSTQLILDTADGIYFLPAYFGTPQKADSLDEAKALWLQKDRTLSGEGDFY